jgi:hypothetical protein
MCARAHGMTRGGGRRKGGVGFLAFHDIEPSSKESDVIREEYRLFVLLPTLFF